MEEDASPTITLHELPAAERLQLSRLTAKIAELEEALTKRSREESSLHKQLGILQLALAHTPDFTYVLDL